MKILPSLASANQMKLEEEIKRLGDHSYLHFDIEDGNFVPNISFGMKTVRAAAKLTDAARDAHLMVTNPLDYIDDLKELDFSAVAFHWESTGYPLRVINQIKKYGMKAGIGINPATDVKQLKPYLNKIDYVLIMTSEPDGQGDQFQKEMIEKVEWLAKQKLENLEIIADGGIGTEELKLLEEAGVTGVVMGRMVFGADDPLDTIQKLSR